jgi:predicted RNA-binding protein YlxR (DUF448 family)
VPSAQHPAPKPADKLSVACDFDVALKGRGFYTLPKNSAFDFALKGRGFSRAVSLPKQLGL